MRKLYLFVNNRNGLSARWLECYSLTDDGYILGNHVCSHTMFMKPDLHDRGDRLEKIKEHFKNEPYEIEILSHTECTTHVEFLKALELSKALKQDFDKAGVIIEFQKDDI